jgi:hypothetical protein
VQAVTLFVLIKRAFVGKKMGFELIKMQGKTAIKNVIFYLQ